MKKETKIIFPIGIIVLVVLAFVGGMLFAKPPSSANTNAARSTDTAGTKSYTNHQLHFSLNYPSMLDQIQESANNVTFGIKGSEDLSGFGVLTKKTSYGTLKDWLNAQPKGSASSAGDQILFWIDSAQFGKAIIAEYLVVDHNGNKPIYGKKLSMVDVQNGMLYEIPLPGQFNANDAPSVGSDMMGVVNSFQALTE